MADVKSTTKRVPWAQDPQEVATAIRAAACSQVSVYRLLGRELVTAAALGLACGALAGMGAVLLTGQTAYGPIIGSALVCAIVWASMVGTITPIVFNRLNIDPALASGPLVTTLNDSFALLIYFGLSMLLVHVVGLS